MSPSSPGFRRRREAPEGEDLGRAEAHGIGAVLDDLLLERPWQQGMLLGGLARRWTEVVGDRLAEESRPVSLVDGILVVQVTSAAWGAQIRFLAEAVRDRTNEALGEAQIRDVRVVVGSRERG